MDRSSFWFLVVVWYLLLAGIVAAGVSRFGRDYIVQWFADPSAKTVLLIVLALLPLPFIVRRTTRS
jgi:hypothetical protein